jgi:hypothetical protein
MNLSEFALSQGIEERTARRWAASGRILAEKRAGRWVVCAESAAPQRAEQGPPVTLTIRCRSFSEAADLLAKWRGQPC